MTDQPTTVFRTSKPKGSAARFVVIDNSVIQDTRLSFTARGVLAYILSCPVTWEHSAESIAGDSPTGAAAVRTALKELQKLGYAEFRRRQTKGGRWRSEWRFHEKPNDEKPNSVGPDSEEPNSGKPIPGRTESGEGSLSESTVSEITIPEKTEEKENTAGKKAASAAGVEDGPSLPFDSPEFVAAWADWLAYRRERRLPAYKPTSLKGQFAALAEWGEAGAIASIRESIRNQWQGLFPPKAMPGGGRPSLHTAAPTAADHGKGFFHGV